jgi:hypothetical protein
VESRNAERILIVRNPMRTSTSTGEVRTSTSQARSQPAKAIAAALLVAIAVALVIGWPAPGGFRAWIAEARDGDDDWGWDLLSTDAHRTYDGDRDAYAFDMAAVDWRSLDLGDPVDTWSDDGFVQVVAELRSEPVTVPAFLLERGIVSGVCDGEKPVAIRVYEDRRLFQGSTFGYSGMTGGQGRCNDAFSRAARD